MIEYSPWPFAFEPESGMGEKHATWIVNIVKPMIDQNYRTKHDKRSTLLAGSFLGGLMSAYMGATYPNIFGCLGIFSLASWICEDAFLDYVAQNHLDVNTKVYIQVGTQEGKGMESDFEDININQVYIDCSLSYYRMLAYSGHNIKLTKLKIFDQETHFEQYWAKHLPEFLKFSLIDK